MLYLSLIPSLFSWITRPQGLDRVHYADALLAVNGHTGEDSRTIHLALGNRLDRRKLVA